MFQSYLPTAIRSLPVNGQCAYGWLEGTHGVKFNDSETQGG